MKITYRTLRQLIDLMDDDQLDSDLTVEILDECGTECYAAELRIAGENHESLDDGHPVVYAHTSERQHVRVQNIEHIREAIGL